MATATLVSEDLRLRNAVMRQLEWDPEVDASEIGVAARNGAVTLTGFIGHLRRQARGRALREARARRARGRQ